MKRIQFAVLVAFLTFVSSTVAGDWLRFRGPGGSGYVADSGSVPTAWSPSANLAWKAELPGPGVSSPIIVGNRVFLTCYSGYGMDRSEPGDMENLRRHLVCIDAASGATVWQKEVAAVLPEDPYSGAGIPAHGYASHTPTSDGERVYVFFGKTGALAFDFDGNQIWQMSLGTESDPWRWGSSSSPIIHEDLLIVTASAESQAIVGLDKATGKEVWRQEVSGVDGLWGTPTLVKIDDSRTDLVLSVPREIWGLNPTNGKLRWFCSATDAEYAQTSAVAIDEVVYVMTGRGGGSIAVRVGGEGDVSDDNILWTGNETTSFGSPVAYDGRVYSVSSGVLSAIDDDTGRKVSELRLRGGGSSREGGRPGGFGRSLDYASPIIAGGRLYYLNGSGETFVVELGDKPKQLRVNRLTTDSESFGGTPAISNGRLFIRSNKHLYCVASLGDSVADNNLASLPADRDDDAERDGGRGRGRGRGRGDFNPAAFFARLDVNEDGKLTASELEASPMAGRLGALDSDGDEAITLDEFQQGIRAMFRGRGGRGQRGGRGFGRGGDDNRPERPQRPPMEG